MRQLKTRLSGPVLGTRDPIALAVFYSRLLGWPIADEEHAGSDGITEDWARIRSPEGGHKIEFQYEPFFTAPVWPSSEDTENEQQMHMHLDIGVTDMAAGTALALELGATEADHQPQEGVRVMLDPAGHPFCLFPDDTIE